MPNNPELTVNSEGEFLEEFSSQFLEEANLLALWDSMPEWAMLFFVPYFWMTVQTFGRVVQHLQYLTGGCGL